MAADYSKHKDQSPEDTVKRIRSILDSAGLPTKVCWNPYEYEGVHSNRVTIAGTSFGTNGKGTTREYALASGYAELMERLQNNNLTYVNRIAFSGRKEGDFWRQPDERMANTAEVSRRNDPALEDVFRSTGVREGAERQELLEKLTRTRCGLTDGTVPEIPFVDVFRGKIVRLPLPIVDRTYGSNGMAAGNTLAEALVQGLSEVFERYVNGLILQGKTVPPPIPNEFLSRWDVGAVIARIEESSRYRVHVYDGSLGRGYPVVMTLIADRLDGTFGIKFGSHPSLPVAVERTLTEAFQGRTLEKFTHINSFSPAESDSIRAESNLLSIVQNGAGQYPCSVFLGKPDWEFRPWGVPEDAANEEMLREFLALLRREGRFPLIRDVSHLGFPSCHILIPGMSEQICCTPSLVERDIIRHKNYQAFSHFPDLSPEDEQALLTFDPLITGSEINTPTMLDRSFTTAIGDARKFFGFLRLRRGDFREASLHFSHIAEGLPGIAPLYWKILANYASLRADGLRREEALEILRLLYSHVFVRRVERDTLNDGQMLQRLFPRMNCDDCDHCGMGKAGGCLGAEDKKMMVDIRRALSGSRVRQEPLLEYFCALI